MGSWVVKGTPRPLYPRKGKPVRIVNRLSGHQRLLEWVRKTSFLQCFYPRTSQPLTRRYTDYSTAA